jgi:hypothetical protein
MEYQRFVLVTHVFLAEGKTNLATPQKYSDKDQAVAAFHGKLNSIINGASTVQVMAAIIDTSTGDFLRRADGTPYSETFIKAPQTEPAEV